MFKTEIKTLLEENNATGVNNYLQATCLDNDIISVEELIAILDNKIKLDKYIYYDSAILIACSQGNLEMVKLLITKCDEVSMDFFSHACIGGNLDLVKYLFPICNVHANYGLYNACQNGHVHIVDWLMQNGATDFNNGLAGAAYGGHVGLVQLMINHGANGLNWAL